MKSSAPLGSYWIASLLSALLLASACTTTIPVLSEGWAIYRPVQNITAAEILKTPLGNLSPETTPVLSLDDIVTYAPDAHSFTLTSSGYDKLRQLRVPTSGIPFIVCVDRQPIYVGAFWASYSSLSYGGVVIDTVLVERTRSARLQLGYPESPGRFTGEDRRSDPRIMRSLERAGKLGRVP